MSLRSSSSAEIKPKAADVVIRHPKTQKPAEKKQKYQISSLFIDIETKAMASLNHSHGFILDQNQLEATQKGTAALSLIITRAQIWSLTMWS